MSIMRNLAATMFGLSAVATVALLGVSPANAGCGGCSYGPPHVIYAPPVEAVFPPPPPPPVHVDFRYHRPHYCGCDTALPRTSLTTPISWNRVRSILARGSQRCRPTCPHGTITDRRIATRKSGAMSNHICIARILAIITTAA